MKLLTLLIMIATTAFMVVMAVPMLALPLTNPFGFLFTILVILYIYSVINFFKNWSELEWK